MNSLLDFLCELWVSISAMALVMALFLLRWVFIGGHGQYR